MYHSQLNLKTIRNYILNDTFNIFHFMIYGIGLQSLARFMIRLYVGSSSLHVSTFGAFPTIDVISDILSLHLWLTFSLQVIDAISLVSCGWPPSLISMKTSHDDEKSWKLLLQLQACSIPPVLGGSSHLS